MVFVYPQISNWLIYKSLCKTKYSGVERLNKLPEISVPLQINPWEVDGNKEFSVLTGLWHLYQYIYDSFSTMIILFTT